MPSTKILETRTCLACGETFPVRLLRNKSKYCVEHRGLGYKSRRGLQLAREKAENEVKNDSKTG